MHHTVQLCLTAEVRVYLLHLFCIGRHPHGTAPHAALARERPMFRRSHGATLTFHVHGEGTHKVAEIADKWLAKPLSHAVISGFLDQARADIFRAMRALPLPFQF